MANSWFRMKSDTLHNPKVQILPESLRWRYVALLCLHCNNDYENRPDDEIALSLRVTLEEWISTRDEFIKRDLLNSDHTIKGWSKHQYISDLSDPTASERQRRYRERQRNKRNATVTSHLPDSDTDTDTDKKVSSRGTRFSLVALPPDWESFCMQERFDLRPEEVFKTFSDYWIAKPGREGVKLDWAATWRNWVRNQNTKGTGNAKSNEPSAITEGRRLSEKYRAQAAREGEAC